MLRRADRCKLKVLERSLCEKAPRGATDEHPAEVTNMVRKTYLSKETLSSQGEAALCSTALLQDGAAETNAGKKKKMKI